MPKTYKILANRSAADVVKNNDITLESGLTIEEAKIASLEYQRQGGHIAVWIEEIEEIERTKPRIVRSIEQDRTGVKYNVVYQDGWAI